jgi:hypothetical protein
VTTEAFTQRVDYRPRFAFLAFFGAAFLAAFFAFLAMPWLLFVKRQRTPHTSSLCHVQAQSNTKVFIAAILQQRIVSKNET